MEGGKDKKWKRLRCPDCSGSTHGVWAEASYGRVITLDQCVECGGVWFDRWELSFVKEGSLSALSKMDIRAFLADRGVRKGEEKCPACSIALKEFSDPFIPKDASIWICHNCKGLWLNRRGMRRYAEHRAALKGVPLKDLDEKEIEALKRLQKELDVKTVEAPGAWTDPLLDAPEVDTREVLTDIAFVILQSLLRLVFKI